MRRYKIVIAPKALRDMQRATDYYNSQQSGLGKRFVEEVKTELDAVSVTPFARAVRYNEIRFAVLKKFPFAAHYYVTSDSVIVLAVISMFMDPESSWIKK
ncbi:MAG: type II toxin-antitoxin system RelE/ParE family toxin [Taibaiella sp.]|nr:type II toxin-antitoxin system RelE/ParE family toxin [Taibaiella sp.]